MCGICGTLEYNSDARVTPATIQRMIHAISHRGPDGRGIHVSGPIGLGHTRLAIIDLHTGAQPLSNEDQTIWVVYNGEIYNYPELRRALIEKGHRFQSSTDTEVIVHLYEEYGLGCLSCLRGMFAFALWDDREKALLLARDRIGIKPLYYTQTSRSLIFGSEIKALLSCPQVKCEVEPQSVDKFLTHLCLPGAETLWKGIYKLEPGFYLLANASGIKLEQYWDLRFVPGDSRRSFEDAQGQLYNLVRKTVGDHMISDVPVGFLLSGGVDSTVVLSCAVRETNKKIKTFTVGFDDTSFEDERQYARLAADLFETEHHEITVTPQEFWDFLPSLVWHMEEPICDPPAVALHYISKLASQHVKVLLSGEGGDEAFGGYNDYRNFVFLERAKSVIPRLRKLVSAALRGLDRFARLRKFTKYSPYFVTEPENYYYSRASSPFSYFNSNKDSLYTSGLSAAVSLGNPGKFTRDLFCRSTNQPLLHQLQYVDIKTSLPEDLLIKADRITMGNSLELRVPFLDHKILEFAAGLPAEHKVRGMKTKRILKEAFRTLIPKEIINRKKAGFPIPLQKWTGQELKGKIREVLLDKRSLSRGYFKESGVEHLLRLSEEGKPIAKEIFALLSLELLLTRFADA